MQKLDNFNIKRILFMNRNIYAGVIILLTLISGKLFGSWSFIFANKNYENNIQMDAFIMSKTALINLAADIFNDKKIEQIKLENYYELFQSKNTYIVLRIKNNGNQMAWGKLTCHFNGFEYNVNIDSLMANMKESTVFVFPLSGFIYPHNNFNKPVITFEWKKLYCK